MLPAAPKTATKITQPNPKESPRDDRGGQQIDNDPKAGEIDLSVELPVPRVVDKPVDPFACRIETQVAENPGNPRNLGGGAEVAVRYQYEQNCEQNRPDFEISLAKWI